MEKTSEQGQEVELKSGLSVPSSDIRKFDIPGPKAGLGMPVSPQPKADDQTTKTGLSVEASAHDERPAG